MEKQIIELLQNLTIKVDNIDGRIDRLEGKFDNLEGRIDGFEGRFDNLEGRFDGFEGRFDNLEGRINGFEGRFENLEGRFDGFEGRFENLVVGQQEIVNELRDFRSETSQNFATLVENDRNLRTEMKTLEQKQDMEIGHLNLKTDALQSEVLRLKRS